MSTHSFLTHNSFQFCNVETDRISATALVTAPKLSLNDFRPGFGFGQVSATAVNGTWFRHALLSGLSVKWLNQAF